MSGTSLISQIIIQTWKFHGLSLKGWIFHGSKISTTIKTRSVGGGDHLPRFSIKKDVLRPDRETPQTPALTELEPGISVATRLEPHLSHGPVGNRYLVPGCHPKLGREHSEGVFFPTSGVNPPHWGFEPPPVGCIESALTS